MSSQHRLGARVICIARADANIRAISKRPWITSRSHKVRERGLYNAPVVMGPCVRVWSREISERFERSDITEAFEAGPIVISHEAVEEGITVSMAREGAAGDAAFRFSADSLGDAAVEAFNEPVGLRPIRSGQTVIDAVVGADEIERVMTGSAPGRLVLHIDGKAVGELGAVVGQDGVNAMREVDQEALEKARRSLGVAPWMDLDIDIAGGAVDRDEGIAFAPLQGRQMLEVQVNEPDTGLFEDTDTGPGRLLA